MGTAHKNSKQRKRTETHKPMGNVRGNKQGGAPVRQGRTVGTCFDPEDGDTETSLLSSKQHDGVAYPKGQ